MVGMGPGLILRVGLVVHGDRLVVHGVRAGWQCWVVGLGRLVVHGVRAIVCETIQACMDIRTFHFL